MNIYADEAFFVKGFADVGEKVHFVVTQLREPLAPEQIARQPLSLPDRIESVEYRLLDIALVRRRVVEDTSNDASSNVFCSWDDNVHS